MKISLYYNQATGDHQNNHPKFYNVKYKKYVKEEKSFSHLMNYVFWVMLGHYVENVIFLIKEVTVVLQVIIKIQFVIIAKNYQVCIFKYLYIYLLLKLL